MMHNTDQLKVSAAPENLSINETGSNPYGYSPLSSVRTALFDIIYTNHTLLSSSAERIFLCVLMLIEQTLNDIKCPLTCSQPPILRNRSPWDDYDPSYHHYRIAPDA